ncbi:MAG: spermine synthase [Syntrophaceae bacterium]|nr:spermine synthase [Syntrophaceae bacterium]
MRSFPLKISLLIMGISSIVAQVLLLRELLISFLGNELTLGVILSNWMLLEAIGAFLLGRSVERTEKRLEIYGLLQIIFSLAFPFAIYLARTFKNFLLTTPGEGLGFAPVFYASFLILLPVAVSHGALFTYGSKLYSQYLREDAPSIGRVYVLEAVGSVIGGISVTFVLIRFLNSFEIAFVIGLLNTLISASLLCKRKRPLLGLQSLLGSLSILLSLWFAYMLLGPNAERIHRTSIRSQWKELQVIHYENSVYGNVTVTKRGEQFTFFTDGVPSITTPVPDIASVEDFVHFPMLIHENPGSVLVLGGGAGGMIHEILKHPVDCVHYVELDPLLLRLTQRFRTPLTEAELSDKRVTIHYADSRFFVNRTLDRFDMIFIGPSSPQDLRTNRLFSSEFFRLAKQKMVLGGMIVLSLPGSLTYISPELRELNGCIFDTLRSVYRYVKVVPGDVNLYLASDSDLLEGVTVRDLIKRLEERKIKTNLFTKGYIEHRLHERWLKWFFQSIEARKRNINSDFHPLAVFFSLSYWNALFSPYLAGPFKWTAGLSTARAAIAVAFFTLLIGTLFLKRPSFSRCSLPYTILTTGFAAMIFDLAIIFTFQTVYGYLYHQIGLLVAVFMVGVALSSHKMNRYIERMRKKSLIFLSMEGGIILFSLLLPYIFSIPSHHVEKAAVSLLLYALFFIMSFLAGASIGLQFPLASRIYLRLPARGPSVARTAGVLYGADLLGGFFGGLLGGVLLLPILGLRESCLMIAMIKVSSLLLFLLFTKIQKS